VESKLDDKAFEELYVAYRPKLLRMFQGMLWKEEYDRVSAAEDLVQDTFIKAWASKSTYNGEAKAATWLHAIAINTLLDHFRKQRVRGFGKHTEVTAFFRPCRRRAQRAGIGDRQSRPGKAVARGGNASAPQGFDILF
jgi:RNA polymerase sigma factor (sigma-70 family)